MVASAGLPSPVASIRTRSSNSSGKVERKIACSGPPYSTIAASRKLVPPPRDAVTSTGMRTGLACGKKRASCSAQSCWFAVSLSSPDFPTSPLALRVRIQRYSCGKTHGSPARGADFRWTEMHAGRQRTGNVPLLQVAEIVRFRVFSARLFGSTVSA